MAEEFPEFKVPIVELLPVAEAGFPDIISPVIFTPGCNFRCRYCLNTDVVLDNMPKRLSTREICEYMDKNKEEYILISGGEPCMWPELPKLVDFLFSRGYKVRLSTNGSFHKALVSMVESGKLSFVAMDIKAAPSSDKLHEILLKMSQYEDVLKSISYLNSTIERKDLPGFTFEFRTTLDPRFIDEAAIREIGSYIHPDAVWFLQQFRARKGLLGGDYMADVEPFSDEALKSLLVVAKERVANTRIRWP